MVRRDKFVSDYSLLGFLLLLPAVFGSFIDGGIGYIRFGRVDGGIFLYGLFAAIIFNAIVLGVPALRRSAPIPFIAAVSSFVFALYIWAVVNHRIAELGEAGARDISVGSAVVLFLAGSMLLVIGGVRSWLQRT